jgi:hypothetical protein
MNILEAGQLVAKVSLADNRVVDEATILFWHETIGDLDVVEAMSALRQFRRDSPGVYLEPGHLLQIVQRAAAADDVDQWMRR